MAGVPFDALDGVATTRTAELARELLVRREKFSRAKSEVEALLEGRDHGLSKKVARAWRKAIRSDTVLPAADPQSRVFVHCRECAAHVAAVEARLQRALGSELSAARASLLDSTRAISSRYLVFGGAGVREAMDRLLEGQKPGEPLPPRKKRERKSERHLLLYLQRICAKNDTVSEFGPGGWGTIEPGAGIRLAPDPGITKRETFLERWTAHVVAAALNSDPEIRAELSPRLNPNGFIEGHCFTLADSGDVINLDDATLSLLERIDGKSPAHSLGVELTSLEHLAERNIVRWEVEVPALEPDAFAVLVSDVRRWRDVPVRASWLGLLEPILALPEKFGQATATSSRIQIMDEAREKLQNLGGMRPTASRFLYSASNAIGEECFRESGFAIGEEVVNELTHDAEAWIDLWRDCYAFAASRVSAGLRGILERAPTKKGVLPLPAFLHFSQQVGLSLTGPAMVGLAHMAFLELKAAFRQQIGSRADEPEVQLTADDCHFVRRNFQYPKFDEYTYPSADIQLSARSLEAVEQGRYEWILAELHPPVALLHHAFYWSCPNKPLLNAAFARTTRGRPNFHFGFSAADFTAHTVVRIFDAIPELTNFVAPQRANSRWKIIPPSEIDVFADEVTGDVGLRRRSSGEYLGSFARAWVIPLGFHPFLFGRTPHMPRLRCGKVIVQRRSWTVTLAELPAGDYTGVSRDLVVAVEHLRAAKGWPRYIYVRPSEQALRRSGAEGRDKDTKPIFIDLESYLFLEIFHGWLVKAGELEVSEMLPDPDHLLWQEKDGRRSFELRTQIVPAE
jgi:hypothetical protein